MRSILLCLSLCLIYLTARAQRYPQAMPNAQANPAIAQTERLLQAQVSAQLNKIDWKTAERKTAGGAALFTIPVVIHVVHNYGAELLPDAACEELITTMNSYFLKTNADTAGIIDKYKPIAANTGIAFALAGKDPAGNPTRGIDHIYSNLYYGGMQQVKMNQWPQEHYLNIWIVNSIYPGFSPAGYSYSSAYAAYYPYYDGIILTYNFYPFVLGGTYARYFAQFFNLPEPCGGSGGTCVDGDGIADTPPCPSFYPFDCINIYTSPCDTPNTQNIMSNYDACALMFTHQQALYMQYILQINVGKRDSLITPYNFTAAGLGQPRPDLAPVADFSVKNLYNRLTGFFSVNSPVRLVNNSWNDTITGVEWTFPATAEFPASTSSTFVLNRFRDTGWVTVSLAATGNNTGTTTITKNDVLYIADTAALPAFNYTQEFEAGAGMAQWPIFNYYGNQFKWQAGTAGFSDNSGLYYNSYDTRPYPANMAGGPQGDIDDIYTPAFDLRAFPAACYLNFMSSGAHRAIKTYFQRDTLEISYSADGATSWYVLKNLTGNELANMGYRATAYEPIWQGDWVPHAIPLPAAARTAATYFRLRYKPGADSAGISSGNYFYLDHFNFGMFPESVAAAAASGHDVILAPNPTGGATSVIIKAGTNIPLVTITVTDVAGGTIYKTVGRNTGSTANIEIPAEALINKGIYFVRIVTDHMNQVRKLVVR